MSNWYIPTHQWLLNEYDGFSYLCRHVDNYVRNNPSGLLIQDNAIAMLDYRAEGWIGVDALMKEDGYCCFWKCIGELYQSCSGLTCLTESTMRRDLLKNSVNGLPTFDSPFQYQEQGVGWITTVVASTAEEMQKLPEVLFNINHTGMDALVMCRSSKDPSLSQDFGEKEVLLRTLSQTVAVLLDLEQRYILVTEKGSDFEARLLACLGFDKK